MMVLGDSVCSENHQAYQMQQIQHLLLWMTAVFCQGELTDESKQVTCSRHVQLISCN